MILASVFLYFTVFFKVPMGSIVISMVSPFLRNLGGLNPIGAGIAALFIGLIDTGAQTVSRVLGVPVYLGDVVQSTLLLVTLGMLLLQNYRIKRI